MSRVVFIGGPFYALTIGKSYEVKMTLEKKNVRGHLIVNDLGWDKSYPIEHFVTEQEWRNEQIKKILK